MLLEVFWVFQLLRSDNHLEIAKPGKSLLKKLIDLVPFAAVRTHPTIISVKTIVEIRRSSEFKHEFVEDRRCDGGNHCREGILDTGVYMREHHAESQSAESHKLGRIDMYIWGKVS